MLPSMEGEAENRTPDKNPSRKFFLNLCLRIENASTRISCEVRFKYYILWSGSNCA